MFSILQFIQEKRTAKNKRTITNCYQKKPEKIYPVEYLGFFVTSLVSKETVSLFV